MLLLEQTVVLSVKLRLSHCLLALLLLPWCQMAAAQQAAVSGRILYFGTAEAVPGAMVSIAGGTVELAQTGDAGGYSGNADTAATVSIVPAKQGGDAAAIGPLDAAYVLQALIGMRQLGEFESLACDVTGDGTVSALDAAHILRYSVGAIGRFAAAERCGSDWIFVPAAAAAANQQRSQPQLAEGKCSPGGIRYSPLGNDAVDQNFTAVLIGDCTGSWNVAGGADVTATPTVTMVPVNTATATASPTATRTPSAISTSSPSATLTPTPSRTFTFTRTPTATRSSTPARTSTRTSTPTRTATRTRTASFTRTPTVTKTPTITRTPTRTSTPSPTPTAVCQAGLQWGVSPPIPVSSQLGGRLWLADTVTTDDGWGIFWLRDDPGFSSVVRLYYAHIDTGGEITDGPMLVVDIPKISSRQRYYMAAWHGDHFAVITAEYSSLYYHSLSKAGSLTARHSVGPNLLYSSTWDNEADGDLESYAGGFVGVIEGDCFGHSCSYAFKLAADGTQTSGNVNLVDFDFTHQFYPRVAVDQSGFAILSVKDIKIVSGGVMTKYWQSNGLMRPHVKVAPSKPYNWDEFPDLAWNGSLYAAVWTENAIRQHGANWQIRFASFERDSAGGSLVAEKVLHGPDEKSGDRWTTRVHSSGNDWVVQYVRRLADGSKQAVFELVDSAAQTRAMIAPFSMTADALGSSPHVLPGFERTIGVARGDNGVAGTTVTFYFLDPPSCP